MSSLLSGRRVLVVEDEPMVAWMLQDMLLGFECTVVGPADRLDEAMAFIRAQPIDAAVLDINLRGQMSYPAADALSAMGIPFVFTTGYARDRLLEGYRRFPYLLKPYHSLAMRDALLEFFPPSPQSLGRQDPSANSPRGQAAPG